MVRTAVLVLPPVAPAMGLAMAHNLLRAQGAQLSLSNREPQGLVAWVVFART